MIKSFRSDKNGAVKLSICIPTYAFGKFIGQTLDSILPQITDEVEVIVLDGGSVDETSSVVSDRQKGRPRLTYHYQSFRGGIDRDIEKVVSLAKGDFCWLFSADDIMLPGAIDTVLEAIKSNDDIYMCEHVLCDLDMSPIKSYPIFHSIRQQRLFNLGDMEDRNIYFRSARTSEAFFSFLSCPIFKKNVWDGTVVPDSFRDTCWIVAGHLLSMIPRGVTVKYLGKTLLKKRGGNDSFSDRGIVNRFRIAIEAFQYIGDAVFGEKSEEAFHIRRVLHLDVTLLLLLYAKLRTAESPSFEDINVLDRIAKKHYSDLSVANFVKYAVYKISHRRLLKFASWILKMLR